MNSLAQIDIHEPIEMDVAAVRGLEPKTGAKPPSGAPRSPSSARACEIVFALMPEFNMISFGAAIAPLRKANRISGRRLYRWQLASLDGRPVRSAPGVLVGVDCAIDEVAQPDLVLVCCGDDVEHHVHDRALRWLRRLAHQKVILGGIDTGTYLLAKSGVLRGYRCTTHWDHRDALIEEHPEIVVTPGICVFDRDRLSCPGGDAASDLMMNFVASEHGHHLAAAIAEELVHERIRGSRDHQRRPLVQHIGTGQPRLLDAVQLMEANLEEPLSVAQIAELAGLSRRQLERLFRKHLGCVPSSYYLRLRLAKAHHLLRQTTQSVMGIGLACGFVSASHFSKAYREVYGHPPRDERRPGRVHPDSAS